MVIYSIIILGRLRRVAHYQSTLEDWSWYMAIPPVLVKTLDLESTPGDTLSFEVKF
jgi:hypothetical protein